MTKYLQNTEPQSIITPPMMGSFIYDLSMFTSFTKEENHFTFDFFENWKVKRQLSIVKSPAKLACMCLVLIWLQIRKNP